MVSESKIDWKLNLHLDVWAYWVAYKRFIGTTPFSMVYVLDAILPLKFLVPTFKAAQEIGWIEHKVSNKVEELEKLNETELAAVTGMYALKRRQKKFHGHRICFSISLISLDFSTPSSASWVISPSSPCLYLECLRHWAHLAMARSAFGECTVCRLLAIMQDHDDPAAHATAMRRIYIVAFPHLFRCPYKLQAVRRRLTM